MFELQLVCFAKQYVRKTYWESTQNRVRTELESTQEQIQLQYNEKSKKEKKKKPLLEK